MYQIIKNYTKASHLIFDNWCEAVDFANGLVEDGLASVADVKNVETGEMIYRARA